MGSLVALLIITVVSLLVVRVGSMALRMTGLSHELASFQACSAFFGVGFTTRESEAVMTHPVRRRIIRDLIVAGNIGVTSSLAAVVLTFLHNTARETLTALGLIIVGLVALWGVSKIGVVRAGVDGVIRWSLGLVGLARAVDYDLLLRVKEGYGVGEVRIHGGHALIGRTLAEARVGELGVIVLGVIRADGSYIGAPKGSTEVLTGDQLTVYGRDADVRRLAGDVGVPPGPGRPVQ